MTPVDAWAQQLDAAAPPEPPVETVVPPTILMTDPNVLLRTFRGVGTLFRAWALGESVGAEAHAEGLRAQLRFLNEELMDNQEIILEQSKIAQQLLLQRAPNGMGTVPEVTYGAMERVVDRMAVLGETAIDAAAREVQGARAAVLKIRARRPTRVPLQQRLDGVRKHTPKCDAILETRARLHAALMRGWAARSPSDSLVVSTANYKLSSGALSLEEIVETLEVVLREHPGTGGMQLAASVHAARAALDAHSADWDAALARRARLEKMMRAVAHIEEEEAAEKLRADIAGIAESLKHTLNGLLRSALADDRLIDCIQKQQKLIDAIDGELLDRLKTVRRGIYLRRWSRVLRKLIETPWVQLVTGCSDPAPESVPAQQPTFP